MPIAVPEGKVSPWGSEVLPPKWELSVWQRSTRDNPLVNIGRDDPLPEESEIVIIGSGLAGASLAYYLLSAPNRPESITVLEARECCSGASGRNAGHCRPDAYRGFNAYAKDHGEEEAAKILKSERITLENVDAFVKKYGVDCEWTPRPTIDVCLSDEFADYASQAYEDAKQGGVDLSRIDPQKGEAAKKVTRSPEAVKSFEWPAATLNPAKLCYGVHKVNQSLGGYQIFTHTPVTGVTPVKPANGTNGTNGVNGLAKAMNGLSVNGNGIGAGHADSKSKEMRWSVNTPRGSVKANKVVFATNAYTKLLKPEMDGLIQPYQAQAVKLDPPPAGGEKFDRIKASMSLRYELHRFYSVAQRPDDSIVIGSARVWDKITDEERSGAWGIMDDSKPGNPERARDAVEAFSRIIPGGGYVAPKSGELKQGEGGYAYHWSGIIGMTPDATPFIGPIPELEGQYMHAGFNGHGMARIFHCSPNLANVILNGDSGWEPHFPNAYKISEERVKKLQKIVQAEGKTKVNAQQEATKLVV